MSIDNLACHLCIGCSLSLINKGTKLCVITVIFGTSYSFRLVLTACQGAKRVSRASKTIKHKMKCQACRWFLFLGPQKTWRSEVQEAWSEDSRKGLLAVFLEKQFSETAWEPCQTLRKRDGYKITKEWPTMPLSSCVCVPFHQLLRLHVAGSDNTFGLSPPMLSEYYLKM